MRYRLKEDYASKSVLIEDVEMADEKLYQDDGVRYGRITSYSSPLKTFREGIIKGIKNGSITNMEKIGTCYKYQWLEIKDGEVTIHDD